MAVSLSGGRNFHWPFMVCRRTDRNSHRTWRKPVPDHEVSRLTKQIDEGTLKAKPRVKFTEGEDVRVIDGPFANFNGVVETVNEDKGKVRVMVSIFGRSTPVELEFVQVEKA